MAMTLKDLGISKANATHCVANRAQYELNEWNSKALEALKASKDALKVRYLHLHKPVSIDGNTVDTIYVSANAASECLTDKTYLTKCEVSSWVSEKTHETCYSLICPARYEESSDDVEF